MIGNIPFARVVIHSKPLRNVLWIFPIHTKTNAEPVLRRLRILFSVALWASGEHLGVEVVHVTSLVKVISAKSESKL